MEDLKVLFLALELGAFLTQLVMLTLQVAAYRRHHHFSFLLLSIGTALSLSYMALLAAPHLVQILAARYHVLYIVGVYLAGLQLPFAIWGTAALFRSYRLLSEGAGHVPPQPGGAPERNEKRANQ